jgi:putative zinc finger/helix-turn-helix YgiT family protein
MEKNLECPYCPGQASLKKEKKDLNFRKEAFTVTSFFYQCDSCKKEFTTTDTDQVTITQVYNQYREKYKIPFQEEIVEIRNKYQVSAAKMSEILGLGTNTYGNYEKGEMPSIANGNLIRMAADPETFIQLLENVKVIFSNSVYTKIVQHLHTILKSDDPKLDYLSSFYESPSVFTGFKKFNLERLKGLLIFFMQSCNPEYNDRIKLNKLLFYTDFLHYANYGGSIAGLKYRAIKYGPVPAYYDQIFSFVNQDTSFSSCGKELSEGHMVELFSSESDFDKSLFTEEELTTLKTVTSRFNNTSSWDIKEISHNEQAWKDLESLRSIINYQEYAFDLSIIE